MDQGGLHRYLGCYCLRSSYGILRDRVGSSFLQYRCPTELCCMVFFDSDDFPSGRNPYDMTKMCEGQIEDSICYPQTRCALL